MNSQIKFLLSGLVIGLILIEFLFRLTGFFAGQPSVRLNEYSTEDKNRLRILTLGESTTADYFSLDRQSAWPRVLENSLRKSGVNARVFNEGIPGTSSPFILSRLRDYLAKYNPDIVISMMGINDVPYLDYSESLKFKATLLFTNLRIFKLAKWMRNTITERIHCEYNYEYSGGLNYIKILDSALLLSKKSSLYEVENYIRSQTKIDLEIALVLAEIAWKQMLDSEKNNYPLSWDKNFAYAYRAFEVYPHNIFVSVMIIRAFLKNRSDDSRRAGVIDQILSCGPNVPDEVMSGLSSLIIDENLSGRIPAYLALNIQIKKNQDSLTSKHYRMLSEIIQKNGAIHIAMQYPTLSMDPLINYFKGTNGSLEEKFSSVLFVSNKENFEKALSEHTYGEIFTDRGFGSWGHTTPYGHLLIVQSLIPKVLKLIDQSSTLKKFSTLKK